MTNVTDDDAPVGPAHGEAPYGRHPDGSAKRSNGGRPKGTGQPRARRPSDSQPRSHKRAAGAPSLKTELELFYGMAAQMIAMRDPICGQAAMAQVPAIAEAWDTWARSNPKVHRLLTTATQGTGPIAVVLAHAPLLMLMTQHHGGTVQQKAAFEQAMGQPQMAEATMAKWQATQGEPDTDTAAAAA